MSKSIDKQTQTELEAAAFRGFVQHLQKRTDVQNIDLMILAGFCRNCLAKWYKKAAIENGIDMDYDQSRQAIYGMAYEDYKEKHQLASTPEQQQAYAAADKAEI